MSSPRPACVGAKLATRAAQVRRAGLSPWPQQRPFYVPDITLPPAEVQAGFVLASVEGREAGAPPILGTRLWALQSGVG